MKKVFVANKSSFGSEFTETFNSLDELKRAILNHEFMFVDSTDKNYKDSITYANEGYSEELFKENSKSYTLYEIDLHDDEYIDWTDYDGQSTFSVRKKNPKLLSCVTRIR